MCFFLFQLTSAEIYFQIKYYSKTFRVFTKVRSVVASVLAVITSVTVAAIGTFLDLDYGRTALETHTGNYFYRIVTNVGFCFIPFMFTCSNIFNSFRLMKRRMEIEKYYTKSQTYINNRSTMEIIMICYGTFLLFWIPYMIIVIFYPDSSDLTYYSVALVGVLRSVCCTFLTTFRDGTFRQSYSHIFQYVFFKINIGHHHNRRRRNAVIILNQAREGASQPRTPEHSFPVNATLNENESAETSSRFIRDP